MTINRDASERGKILGMLADNDAISAAITFVDLLRAIDNELLSLSPRELGVRLEYLAAKSYIEVIRRKDMPGFDRLRGRGGRGRPQDIVAIKLTPRGLDLFQGAIPADPGVAIQ
jgi:hypothetical protein